MPSETFNNLSNQKKERIQNALLQEFSTHSLADSQVARIVKDARIARGAFYKYFIDLTDAYQYEFRQALNKIHAPVLSNSELSNTSQLIKSISHFLDSSEESEYRDLLKFHFLENQYLLKRNSEKAPQKISDEEWAKSTLIHQTIREGLKYPADKQQFLARLEKSLNRLEKGK